MNTKKLLSFIVALATGHLFAANVQIRDIVPTVVLPAANTFTIVDGATQGTAKFVMTNLPQITTTRTTLAALSITSVPTGVAVQTLGGSAIGDGNASLYYYSSTSTATPNGTTVIQPAVGSGRWLIAVNSGLPAPSVSTLGGVFSKAGVAHQYLSALDTAGNFTLSTVGVSDITGLGTMASQNASAVVITGGTIAGLGTPLAIADGGTGATSASTARTALGVTATGSDTTYAFRVNNLSDLSNAALARGNLGLGTMAVQNSSAISVGGGNMSGMTSYAGGTGAFTGNVSYTGATNGGFSATDSTVTGVLRPISGPALAIGTSSNHPVSLWVNSAAVGQVTSTGLNGIAIGQTTPAASTFTTTSWSSNANVVTTKNNLNLRVINVRDSGATGNGTTDDITAINAAVARMTNYSALYFPPGKYRITSGLTALTGLTGIMIYGEGAEIFNDSGSAGGNTIVVSGTCNGVQITGLRFTGSSTVRGSGIHLRVYCSNVQITNNYLQGCSDFAIHLSNDQGGYSQNVIVANNVINAPIGDGIHFGNVFNGLAIGNTINNTGDDGMAAVADDPSHPPNRISFIGNTVEYAGNGHSNGSGLRINEGVDILAEGNTFYTTQQAAIEVNRYLSPTAYNARISLVGNKIFNSTNAGPGPRGAINILFCNQLNILNNQIIDTVNGSAIALLDINDAVIKDNFIRKAPFRGIAFDDSTTTGVGTNWRQITITGNDFDWVQANEALYCVPPSTVTVTNLMITNNTSLVVPGGAWIAVNRVDTARIYNNTQAGSGTVSIGGTVTNVLQGNNN